MHCNGCETRRACKTLGRCQLRPIKPEPILARLREIVIPIDPDKGETLTMLEKVNRFNQARAILYPESTLS